MSMANPSTNDLHLGQTAKNGHFLTPPRKKPKNVKKSPNLAKFGSFLVTLARIDPQRTPQRDSSVYHPTRPQESDFCPFPGPNPTDYCWLCQWDDISQKWPKWPKIVKIAKLHRFSDIGSFSLKQKKLELPQRVEHDCTP